MQNNKIVAAQFIQLQQQLNKRVCKLTQQHKSNIIATMFAELQHFVAMLDAEDTSYLRDVTYNATALSTFNSTSNVEQLFNSVLLQDTYVRDYFAKTVRYITKNKLA